MLVSAAASVAVLAFATPASAEKRTLLVTLLGGSQITVTVDVPPGTPLDQIQIPGVSLPVVGVQDVTPASTTPTATTPPATTPTNTTPTHTTTTNTTPTQTTTTHTTPSRPSKPHKPGSGGGHHSSPAKDHQTSSGAGHSKNSGSNAKSKARHKHETLQKSLDKAAKRKHHTLRDKGGAPTAENPTFSLSEPGPAAIGVPNFFIDRFRVPPFLLTIYQAAGTQYGIPWQVLASINEIETDYGRNLNISTAGAVGWMQFLPSTWRQWGVDANEDGRKDPYNPVDAIFAAARYLKAAGGDKNLKRAIFAYNHADWYVQSVLLRARLLGGLPDELVSSLTGLTQGQFPVAARARYADDINEAQASRRVKRGNAAQPVESSAARTGIDIFARKGARVIATQDGKILKTGTSKRLGRYVVLQDVYGNRYTYGQLGSVSRYYAVPKPEKISPAATKQLRQPKREQAPTAPATAGVQRAPAKHAAAKAKAAKQTRARHAARHAARPRAVAKERLFAHPSRPRNLHHGGKRQLVVKPKFTTFKDYFTVALGIKRNDVTLKRLKPGAQVIAGTVLGRIGATEPAQAPHVHFEIRPAGKGAPRIDPKPILDGWKLLEATAIYRAAGKNPFLGGTNPSAGQVLLMSKETLQRRVLNDPHVDIYACGRHDIAAGGIDRRVLATLEFLVANGLDPTVSALHCGHSFLTTSGNVSEHSSGNAVDIAMINGIPITGHQGPGSITDITIRRLLTLQGVMKPHQIISLMTFRGVDNTLALPDHYNHIHVGFRPQGGVSGKLGREVAAILKPKEWTKLVARLGEIENPVVSAKPSKYAIKDRRAGSGD